MLPYVARATYKHKHKHTHTRTHSLTRVQGKRPIDYCTFEEGFPLKVLAGVFDVYVIYDDSAHAFVGNLYAGRLSVSVCVLTLS